MVEKGTSEVTEVTRRLEKAIRVVLRQKKPNSHRRSLIGSALIRIAAGTAARFGLDLPEAVAYFVRYYVATVSDDSFEGILASRAMVEREARGKSEDA